MRHGLDALGIRAIQLAYEIENARQALLINRDLRLIQLETRELRDVFDVCASECHVSRFREAVRNPARKAAQNHTACLAHCRIGCYVTRAFLVPLTPFLQVSSGASCSNVC